MSKTRPLSACALDLELLEQALVDIALAGFLGDEVPEVADLGLADAVDAAEALFQPVRVPRQVVVDHQVGVLEVDAFASGIRGDEDPHVGVGAEQLLDLAALVAVTPAVDGDDGVGVAEQPADLLLQVVQRVAVLGEDDQLALAPEASRISGVFWRSLREFVPLAVLAGCDDRLGLLLQALQDDDLGFQFVDGLGGGGLIDERLLELSPAPRRSGRRRPRASTSAASRPGPPRRAGAASLPAGAA